MVCSANCSKETDNTKKLLFTVHPRPLAAQGSLRQRIKSAGGVECVKQAVNASNATADTKTWGNDLLDKLT